MPIYSLVISLILIVAVTFTLLGAAAYLVLLERRIAAWVQDRHGPNRVGLPLTNIRLFGLGQPIADALKMILKEEYTPGHVDRRLYWLAPIVMMAAALATYAVIPVGSVLPPLPQLGWDEPIPLVAAPAVDVGMIYVFALSSIAVYGVILGGWASNSKYSFLGGLRSSAQMIAYELPLGLGILGVVLVSHSLRLDQIINSQVEGVWNVLLQPLGFLVFLIAAWAESGRLPFDLTECEQELVAGYHTEYAGMKLVLFMTAEFIHMITASFLITILFLGGWHLPWITGTSVDQISWGVALLRIIVLFAKVMAVIFFFMLVRWSWPRFRFDQLMSLAWKVMLPLGIVNLIAVASWSELMYVQVDGERLESIGGGWAPWWGCLFGWVVAAVACSMVAWFGPLAAESNRPCARLNRYDIDAQV